MGDRDAEYQKLARDAAARIDRDQALARQLTLLPDEVVEREVEAGPARPGRPKGAKNRTNSQLRDWLASRGYRMPEDVLAEMLGMAGGDGDLMAAAMVETERVLAWAGDGARNIVWTGSEHRELDGPWQASPRERLETFKGIYAAKVRAAEALLPYVAPKASGGDGERPAVNIFMPSAPTGQAAPRDVTPSLDGARQAPFERAAARRAAKFKSEENQDVSGDDVGEDRPDRRTHDENGGKSNV